MDSVDVYPKISWNQFLFGPIIARKALRVFIDPYEWVNQNFYFFLQYLRRHLSKNQ